MGIERISDHVFSVGVMNPGLRVFDIVMEANFGTSYNAYLVTGAQNALVETVHADFFEDYLYNLQSLVDLQDIQYLVINHTELDHSGSVSRILEINPSLTVVCTAPAQTYLKAILNRDFSCRVVKHGDKLELGGATLHFVVAPMLHWPDSMMTYLEEDELLFSCDFLGCHFCEPGIFDSSLHYREAYLGEFRSYYQGIFAPFAPHVLAGLEKLDGLVLSAVCPSHGPVLTDSVPERLADYRRWSTPPPKREKTVLLLYASAYGCTRRLAEAARQAISSQTDVKAVCLDAAATPLAKLAPILNEADALLAGSATMNRNAPKCIWEALASVDAINTKDKPAGVFGSYGWSGEAPAMLKNRLADLKYRVLGEGIRVNFMPTEQDLAAMAEYAVEVVNHIK